MHNTHIPVRGKTQQTTYNTHIPVPGKTQQTTNSAYEAGFRITRYAQYTTHNLYKTQYTTHTQNTTYNDTQHGSNAHETRRGPEELVVVVIVQRRVMVRACFLPARDHLQHKKKITKRTSRKGEGWRRRQFTSVNPLRHLNALIRHL